MNKTIVLHTENREKLIQFFEYFNSNFKKNDFNLILHSKNYAPWTDEKLKVEITSFPSFYAFPTNKNNIQSIVEMLIKTKTDEVIILDEENTKFKLIKDDTNSFNFLYTDTKKILGQNLDTNYNSIDWFIIDVLSQIKKEKISYKDDSSDCLRYNEKIEDIYLKNVICILS